MRLPSCLDCIWNRSVRVLLIGLDGSGKTTILYKIVTGDVVTTIPTVGYNVETVKHKNISFEIWDAGGQASIRAIWRMYFLKSQVMIFVVDSNERDRLEEARKELFDALKNPDLGNAALLVLANKQVIDRPTLIENTLLISLMFIPQDIPGALPSEEIIEKLDLRKINNREYSAPSSIIPLPSTFLCSLPHLQTSNNSQHLPQYQPARFRLTVGGNFRALHARAPPGGGSRPPAPTPATASRKASTGWPPASAEPVSAPTVSTPPSII